MRLRETSEILAAADPVDADGLANLDLTAAEEELVAGIVSRPRQARVARAASPSRRVGRLVPAVAVAALATIGVIVTGLPGGGGNSGSAGLTVLDRVARAAAEQPPPDPTLPYGYLKTRGTYLDTTEYGGEAWSVFQDEIDETWVSRNGAALRRTVTLPATFAGPADKEAWERAGKPEFLAHGWGRHVGRETFPPGTFHKRLLYGFDLSELPGDPEQLSHLLVEMATDPNAGGGAGNGFPVSVRTLAIVAELLQNPLATPQQRAALYEAEALVPGVEDLGPTTDQLGRHGVAVGDSSANSGAPTVYSLIFDPDTSQVLATEEERLQAPSALPPMPAPRVVSSTAYLRSATTVARGESP